MLTTTRVDSAIANSPPAVRFMEHTLQLDRILGYSGGPLVLLYDGEMLVFAAGCSIVMINLRDDGIVHSDGLWKAFNSTPGGSLKQGFLKGHSEAVTLLQVSVYGVHHSCF